MSIPIWPRQQRMSQPHEVRTNVGDVSLLDVEDLVPRENRVLVALATEMQTKTGLLVALKSPEERPGEPLVGEIVALGPDASEDLLVGMTVLTGHYQWAHLSMNGKRVVLVTDKDIHGIIPGQFHAGPAIDA